jgi:hypothetical protein
MASMTTREPGWSLATAALLVVLSAGAAPAGPTGPRPAPGARWGAPAGQEKPPVPRPFPKPAEPAQAKPAAPQRPSAPGEAPSEATLGLPIYPTAQFLASYDAGQGQRYYLFGATASFADVVAYYRSVLKQRGDLVFEEPPTWMFEVGRFDENKMAFPPGVTVKDYAWGGLQGYLNPKRDGKPPRFPTVIQIVAVPPGSQQP